ncbi:MAG: thiamine phosphate synthase [Actinomycetota bacterium]
MKPGARRERLARSRLYVVTDAREEEGDLAEFLAEILDAGVDIIQLREKNAEVADLLKWGEVFREAAARNGALFILNDRPDVALALDADGVHLGQEDLPLDQARAIMGADAILGLSTHSPEQWDGAAPEADYLCAGPVWETPTKPGRPAAGIGYIRYAATSGEKRPWFAIGGIDQENVARVIEAGASRIVVVRAVTETSDPRTGAEALSRYLARASGARS